MYITRMLLISLTALCIATPALASKKVSVPANRPYVDAGLDVKEGEALRITAAGEIEISDWAYFGRDGYDWHVGPRGTFRCEKSVKDKTFPLPVIQKGAAPCY